MEAGLEGRPPGDLGASFPCGAQVSVETHLSPQGSDLTAHGGLGVQGVAEAVGDAKLQQSSAIGITRVAGTQVEATCSLKAMLEGTSLAGSNEVSWADEENSGSEGSNSRAVGGFRAPLSKFEFTNVEAQVVSKALDAIRRMSSTSVMRLSNSAFSELLA